MPLSFPAIDIGVGGPPANWWDEINESVKWQDGIFFSLCAAYAAVSAVALIQLIRIELRVPEYGWTTQKVFHLMNFIVNGGPDFGTVGFSWLALLFHVYTSCPFLGRDISSVVGLTEPTAKKNCDRVVMQDDFGENVGNERREGAELSLIALRGLMQYPGENVTVMSFIAALGFLLYGGRLFFMLRRFPIESKGRRKKLHEVGSVTAICFTCFLIRCFVVVLSAFDLDASLDVLDHPVLNLIYYTLVEILPSVLVLYILRKLPPKRISAQYHPIR
ncbi:hypothetical protein DH2020_017295 [Rehmannia glutinosa]|uniref:THH1/TOM1/TOM3 domain-containing protein n=1 Tax=Rehmannia glutinosa TaxID=99300 RepID=A0ABR0WU83_REHGL